MWLSPVAVWDVRALRAERGNSPGQDKLPGGGAWEASLRMAGTVSSGQGKTHEERFSLHYRLRKQ